MRSIKLDGSTPPAIARRRMTRPWRLDYDGRGVVERSSGALASSPLAWGSDMYRTASRQLVKVSLIVIGFVALASHDPARADEPAKPRGPILELRILATPKHDEGAIAKSQADELERPPLGYRWVVVSLTVKGKSPAFGEKTLTDMEARWKARRGWGVPVPLGGRHRRQAGLGPGSPRRDQRRRDHREYGARRGGFPHRDAEGVDRETLGGKRGEPGRVSAGLACW